MTSHNVVRFADERGYRGLCGCGWRVTTKTRDERELRAREHETADSLKVEKVASPRTRSGGA